MEISDVFLRGDKWNEAIDSFKDLFTEATQYEIYVLAISIGIMYDKKIEKLEGNSEPHTIGRNVFNKRISDGKLDFMFQAAILTTRTIDLTEDERLELAFGDKKTDFNKLGLLTEFANFGVTKLLELVGSSTVETMENIKNFLNSTLEGRNFDIDALSDDELLDGFQPEF